LLGPELGQDLESSLSCRLSLLGSWLRLGRRRHGVRRLGRVELHLADIQVFFEAVDLEEVGEFEGSDVSSSFPDFPLEIADDFLEIGFIEAGVEEFIPEPFPIKVQAHALAGQPAV